MPRLPQEVLDMVIKEVDKSDEPRTVNTLKSLRRTSKACNETATALLFSQTSVSIRDSRRLYPIRCLSNSKYASLVRKITICSTSTGGEWTDMWRVSSKVDELKMILRRFVNLQCLGFVRDPSARLTYAQDTLSCPHSVGPPLIYGQWTRLLCEMVHPNLETLILEDHYMLKFISCRAKQLSGSLEQVIALQQNMANVRHLHIREWQKRDWDSLIINTNRLYTSTWTLDRLEFSNIRMNCLRRDEPFLRARWMPFLQTWRMKHLVLANCEVKFATVKYLLENSWRQMETLSMSKLKLFRHTWGDLFRCIPEICPNLTDVSFEALSYIQHPDWTIDRPLSDAGASCRFCNEDITALIFLVRTILGRRRAAGLCGKRLGAYAQSLGRVTSSKLSLKYAHIPRLRWIPTDVFERTPVRHRMWPPEYT